jgi:hypothetical protein
MESVAFGTETKECEANEKEHGCGERQIEANEPGGVVLPQEGQGKIKKTKED